VIHNPVEELILNFINFSQDLHEPVAYVFETDLDFAYEETMFPIAEEKLLKHLSS
jgi:hypothetical protein